MRPLYIEGNGNAWVALEGPALCVSASGKAEQLFPLVRISRVIVSGAVDFSCEALLVCADQGISVTFLNENGGIRARWLAKPGDRQTVVQRLADLIGRADGLDLYRSWFIAMERMAVRSTAKRLTNNRQAVVESIELRAFLDFRKQSLHDRAAGKIFDMVKGLLSAQVVQLFQEAGLGAKSELLQEHWLDLPRDFTVILFWDMEVPLLSWLESLENDPALPDAVRFYERRSGRIAHLFRGLFNKLHCWLVELH